VLDALRIFERDVESRERAGAPAEQRGRCGLERQQQRGQVFAVLGRVARGGRRRGNAALVSAAVVSDDTTLARQRQQHFIPNIGVEARAVDQDERLATAGFFVEELNAVDRESCHAEHLISKRPSPAPTWPSSISSLHLGQ
jgi:hypothetical protein